MKNLLSTENQKKYLYIFGLCLFFGIFAHGYRLINNLYTHDGLLDVIEENIQYQRALGRFMQTFTILIRGAICTPWLIGIIGIIFLSLSVYLIVDLLEIKNKLSIALIAGIMICNIVITTSAAAFIPWFDVYAVALFFASLGAWMIAKNKLIYYIAGGVSLIISLGFYQAYVDVALFLLLIFFLKQFRNAKKISTVWVAAGKTAVTVLCSAIGYYAVFKLVCKIHHVDSLESYNSLTQLSNISGSSVFASLATTYKTFFEYFTAQDGFYAKIGSHTDIWHTLTDIASVATLLMVIVGLTVLLIKKKPHWSVLLIHIIGVIAVPVFANAVCIMSSGMEHILMVYSFILVFVWAISLWEECGEVFPKKIISVGHIAAIVLTLICVWNNIVFSNQLYYRIDLQDKAFDSFATRMVNDIENVEGYEYGSTKVVIYGSFENSPYINNLSVFENVNTMGVGKTPISYMQTFYSYASYYQNIKMNFTFASEPTEEIINMPSYPAAGSIVTDGDQVIIKISD